MVIGGLINLVAAFASQTQERIPQVMVERLVDAVCEKQIVLLGEPPSHGEALAFDAKARVVEALVRRCGFKAVLFEAGIYDFIGVERAAQSNTATQEHLDNAIGRFWWTRELTPWRRALFEAAMRRTVLVGGLDDQASVTAAYARAVLPQLVSKASPESAARACRETVDRHLRWTYDAGHPFDDRERSALQRCARDAAAAAVARQAFDAADRVMLESFARYADRQRSGAASNRDESMFRNLAWYVDRLPANSRVVVWTATMHAARQRGSLAEVPLGAYAVERWGDRVAAIGFTAYGGHTSRAARPASPIPEAPAASLEATATKATAWALLDAQPLRALGSVPSRLLGTFRSDTWSNYFDAVVVIRDEVAPTFDPWK